MSVATNTYDIDEMADRIYSRIARSTRRHENLREGCSSGEFKKYNPLTFSEEPDPVVAEKWLLRMKKMLRVLNCIDTQKVRYATFTLKDIAKRWWDSIELLLKEELGKGTSITWDKLKEAFNDNYYPEVVKDQKESEFSNLVQGPMTIELYTAKFTELSHFAPHLILNKGERV
ncbi:uncharacterized protein LOC121265861 [Juglans microcarpa x Juglans regia]|uniref:uncharacterized protein LOC121265861 n=1 Tax=Juglans microcarpa x Juglans regia TaxID=2249226 RepID=UPI001B7E5E4B|nr:uncharacterized protein LOC121265861 [Juglans microcarpa x Juglans regia]